MTAANFPPNRRAISSLILKDGTLACARYRLGVALKITAIDLGLEGRQSGQARLDLAPADGGIQALVADVDDHVMDIVVWNDQGTDPNGKNLTYQTGVIPIPPNFLEGGMRFDFVDLDEPGGTVWSFLKTGADIYQILYGTPMTQAQMDKLK